MDKNLSKKMIPYALIISMFLSGCGEKSECEIPTRHVHKYTKQLGNGIILEKYLDDEHLNLFEYDWNNEYIEINKDDEKVYNVIRKYDLLDGVTNWDYLYNEMSTHHDYLEFYYHYTTTETYTTTDGKGKTQIRTRTVTHSGWTQNPNRAHNTGRTRLCHHRYFGYRLLYENGKFKAEKSETVDDIRDVIYDYPYFTEDCISIVSEEYRFNKWELENLSPEEFDVFKGPNLDNKNLEKTKVKIKSK